MRAKLSFLACPEALLFMAIVGMGSGLVALSERPPIVFRSLHEIKALAARHGLYVGAYKTSSEDNCFVAERPVAVDDLPSTRRDCGLTPAWRGVVWIVRHTTALMQLDPRSITGHYRIWGELLAAGDPALLDRIEELFRR